MSLVAALAQHASEVQVVGKGFAIERFAALIGENVRNAGKELFHRRRPKCKEFRQRSAIAAQDQSLAPFDVTLRSLSKARKPPSPYHLWEQNFIGRAFPYDIWNPEIVGRASPYEIS